MNPTPRQSLCLLIALCVTAVAGAAQARIRGRVEITRSSARTQVAEVDHVTAYKLPDGRLIKRTVTFHDWIRKGKPVSTDWTYTNAKGTRKQLLIDYVFEPGSRSKLSSWTAKGTNFTAGSHISPEGKTTSWHRSARHGAGPIHEVGRHKDGVRFDTVSVPKNGRFVTTTTFTQPDGRTAMQKHWVAKDTIFVHTTMRRADGTISQVSRRGQHRSKTLSLPRPFPVTQ